MNEHRIVIVIDAVYRTDDPAETVRHLMDAHYAITSKRAQAKPARHSWALVGASAERVINTINNLENAHAPE